MGPTALEARQAFRPAVKAGWKILLRDYEIGRKIPADALNAGMEETLAQLWKLVSKDVALEVVERSCRRFIPS